MKTVSNSMQPYDVSLLLNPSDVTRVTLVLEGSNVGRGDKWYVMSLFNHYAC